MRRLIAATPVVLVAAAGCLASKGDIRLLQQEFATTRSQIGAFDTSVARANEQHRQQIAAVSASVERIAQSLQRTNDSLRVLALRVGNAGEGLDVLGRQIIQMQQLLGANVRNLQDARAALDALRDQSSAMPPTPPPTGRGGSAAPVLPNRSGAAAPVLPNRGGSATPQAGTPSAITLFVAGKDALSNGAYSTARESFQQLLTSWPNSEEAPRAMLFIGDSYADQGNKVAADSVYQLVPVRFPKTDAAANALFKRAQMLAEAKKNSEARLLLDRVIKDFPNSDAAVLARDLLKSIR
jgi:tol-pal system protein YbgF